MKEKKQQVEMADFRYVLSKLESVFEYGSNTLVGIVMKANMPAAGAGRVWVLPDYLRCGDAPAGYHGDRDCVSYVRASNGQGKLFER